jgi:uncharacterized protein (DUF927 family)
LPFEGFPLPPTEDLRHCELCTDYAAKLARPAMIARVRRADTGEPTGGIHRTYLREDGRPAKEEMGGKHKMGLGPAQLDGGVVMLAPMTADGRLGVAEGTETALAMTEINRRATGNLFPIWATLGDWGMANMPFPPGLKQLLIFADGGKAGIAAAERLQGRALAAGIEALYYLPKSGDDFARDLELRLWETNPGESEPSTSQAKGDAATLELQPGAPQEPNSDPNLNQGLNLAGGLNDPKFGPPPAWSASTGLVPPQTLEHILAAAASLTRDVSPQAIERVNFILRGVALARLDGIGDRQALSAIKAKTQLPIADLRRQLAGFRREMGLASRVRGGVVAGEPRIAAEDWRCFGSYRMTEQGLFWVDPEYEKPDLFLANAFEVLAQTRDSRGSDWGLLLRWCDPDGRMHEWAMPREVLGGRGDELWRNLLRDGLTIASSTASRNKLADYLGSVQVEARARSVTRIGWHASASGQVFVLPDATFGETAGERVLWQTETRNETFFNVSGSLEDWRKEVARRCIGNSRLVMAASTSFASPLLELANEESGGVQLVGRSRTGKTATLRVAGSVWGGGGINGFIRTWRATANGLEGIAELHSDALLPLDEMSQVDAREAGEIAYMLANGAGKGRAGRDGSARRSAQWRLLFLSSGELSLADKMAEAGKRVRAGQEVRLVDVPADAGAGMGIFEDLHGAPSSGEFAEILRNATARCYGTPIRAYLDALTERLAVDRDGLRQLLETTRREFMSRHLPAGASAQVRSVCGRFALIGAAGSLATAFGVTGWPDDETDRAAGVCFQAWLQKRGTVGDQEIESGIRQVIRFLEEHGSARFEPAWEESGEPYPGVVTTVTAGSSARLPENPLMNQNGSHGNRGNRAFDGYAAGLSEIEPVASIDLNQENRLSTASPFGMRTINRAGFRRRTAEGLWQYMALPEAWRIEITKGFDPHGLARAMVDRGLIIPDPTRKTPARQVSVREYGKLRLYVFKAGILGDAMIVSGDGERS